MRWFVPLFLCFLLHFDFETLWSFVCRRSLLVNFTSLNECDFDLFSAQKWSKAFGSCPGWSWSRVRWGKNNWRHALKAPSNINGCVSIMRPKSLWHLVTFQCCFLCHLVLTGAFTRHQEGTLKPLHREEPGEDWRVTMKAVQVDLPKDGPTTSHNEPGDRRCIPPRMHGLEVKSSQVADPEQKRWKLALDSPNFQHECFVWHGGARGRNSAIFIF